MELKYLIKLFKSNKAYDSTNTNFRKNNLN